MWDDTILTQVDFHCDIESKHVIIWLLVKIIHDADKHPQGSINDIVVLLKWIWEVWLHWTDIRQILVLSEENKNYLLRNENTNKCTALSNELGKDK